MSSRLKELLTTEEVLYGVICRDTTMTDLELMAQLGYSVVFLTWSTVRNRRRR